MDNSRSDCPPLPRRIGGQGCAVVHPTCYSYGDFADREAFLEAFSKGISDSDSWYQDAPLLKSEIGPVQICSLDAANFVEPGLGAAIYLALMKRK